MSDNETALSPSHYSADGFQTCEFVELVVSTLGTMGGTTPEQAWHVGSALKYAMRAGKKGDWTVDAVKCANFLCRAINGRWLDE